jgi:hypothetical protein
LQYDNSLRRELYADIKYVLFISQQRPNIAFSGLFYPDFDVIGNQLQDLGDHDQELQLITMCSSPMANNKWGFYSRGINQVQLYALILCGHYQQ